MYPPTKLLVLLLEQHRITSHSIPVIFQIEIPCSRNTYPVCPSSMPYVALPQTFPKIPKSLATDTKRSTKKLSLLF